jgi:N-acetylglucosaminyldiphosphoundecaprenol N-acetyl-beta-D-mannosaminyltransferase
MLAHQRRGTLKDCRVLGIDCFAGNLEAAAQAVVERARDRRAGYCCCCNVHVLTLALHDTHLRDALRDAWAVFPDGAPIAWLERRYGAVAERVAGPDLMPAVLALGMDVGLRHYLLGSTSEVLDRLTKQLALAFPDAQIVGALSPPVTTGEPDVALDAISATQPDIVWCAFGAPKQELWMHQHSAEVPSGLMIGVGAAFDFLAGTKQRAPKWLQDHSLEWLHRLVSEPRRLSGRYISTNSEFIVRATIEIVKNRPVRRVG